MSGTRTSELETRVNGASIVTASGSVDRQDAFVSGASRYEALDLESRDSLVEITGTSFAVLSVRETLTGQATGAGMVGYAGDPAVSVTGSVAPH